jgi:tRNA-splicing ligase RtcB
MTFALKFAAESRRLMMNEFFLNVFRYCGGEPKERIDIHHNFAALENHFGKNVWVHRKGATQARDGQLGIISGSMGTASYIVRGKGNPESFMSCSHGAGRIAGRKAFCREHTVDECNADMSGVVFPGWGKDRKGNPDISEAPKAYKDIDEVIAAEADLIDVVVRLKPLGVLKG